MTIRACSQLEKLENDCYDWYQRHAEKLSEAAGSDHDLVLIGDSITHFWSWPEGQYPSYQESFGAIRTLNLGFGWDRTPNALWRLAHGEMANQHPRWVVVNIGGNNQSVTPNYPGDTPEETAQGVRAVVDSFRALAPEAKIIVMAVFQRGTNAQPNRAWIRRLNPLIREQIKGLPGVEFLDISERFMGADGEIDSSLFRGDNCHPCDKGYRIWAEALKPLLV